MKETQLNGFCFGVLALVLVPVFFAVCASLCSGAEGVWHKQLGELDFYVVQDKAGEMNNAIFGDDPEIAQLAPAGKSPSSYNVFLLKKGKNILLIDTGVGDQMLSRLQKIGIQPEDITSILLTHTHGDHVGGLLKGDAAAFPKAKLYLSEKEWKFWNETNQELAKKCAKVYGEPIRFVADEKTELVLPELVAFDIEGHTPGHTGFLISAGKEKIVVVADLLHSGAIQFARPDINARFDKDGKKAAEARQKWMNRAAQEDWLFAASHLPFPSVGKVQTSGKGFRFTPAPLKSEE